MKQSGVQGHMVQDDEMSTYVWFKDLKNLRSIHSRYQQMLIAKALSDLFGHPFSFPEHRDESSRLDSLSRTATGSAPSSARSLNSSAAPSVSFATSSETMSVAAPPAPPPPPPPPMVSSVPLAERVVHDVSFLQEYNHLFTPGCRVCRVQFKHIYRDYVLNAQQLASYTYSMGDFLLVVSHVETDQMDLGILIKMFTHVEYIRYKETVGRSQDREENFVSVVLRIANRNERRLLPAKFAKEAELLRFAQRRVQEAGNLPMNVHGVEFQYDGQILFVYYTSEGRVDYRTFVYDMMKECNNTRVKMKKTNNCRPFVPNPFAQIALCTGSSIK